MSTKSVQSVQKTSDNAGGKHSRGFAPQHKTFGALNYAQDFGTTVKESLKTENYEFEVAYTHRKVELSHVKYFHAFVSTLNYVSSIGAKSDWIHQLNSKIMVQVCYLKGNLQPVSIAVVHFTEVRLL